MEQPLRDHTGLNEDMISKNGGTDYRPKGDPRRVNMHDFEDKELGKVAPYGVYDVTANAGWGSVRITCDTAQFAVASIRRWLDEMGRERYPRARELTITADGGGSNGTRVRLWKVELQKLADATSLVLHVHHYLIVIDELGYLRFSQPGGQLLFHLISKLYENTSLLITANLAFADWPQNTLDWTPYLILDYSQDHT